MKNVKMNLGILSSLALALTCIQTAGASCLSKEELVTDRQAIAVGDCSISKAPRLLQGAFSYHNMKHNPHQVSYWSGEYSRDVTIQETVLRDIVDSCATDANGNVIRTVLKQETIPREVKSSHSFSIDNPNLDSELAPSYSLAPLTSDEVNAAMDALKLKCEAYSVADANSEMKGK